MNAPRSARESIEQAKVMPKHPTQANFSCLPGADNDSFDFDVWAGAVRQQMLEVLHKRECRRS